MKTKRFWFSCVMALMGLVTVSVAYNYHKKNPATKRIAEHKYGKDVVPRSGSFSNTSKRLNAQRSLSGNNVTEGGAPPRTSRIRDLLATTSSGDKDKNSEERTLSRHKAILDRANVSSEGRVLFASMLRKLNNINIEVNEKFKSNEFASRAEAVEWARAQVATTRKEIMDIIGESNMDAFYTVLDKEYIYRGVLQFLPLKASQNGCTVSNDTIEKLQDVFYTAYKDTEVSFRYMSTQSVPLPEEQLQLEVSRRKVANELILKDAKTFMSDREVIVLEEMLSSMLDTMQQITRVRRNAATDK